MPDDDDFGRLPYRAVTDPEERELALDWVRGSVMFRRVDSPLDTPTTTDIRDRVATALGV